MSPSTQMLAKAAKMLAVDDDPTILSQMQLAFRDEYNVFTADRPELAWELIREQRPELIVLDLALEAGDPESGFSLLERCLEFDPLMKIILITGNDTHANAMRAVNQGAHDFLGKPVDLDALRLLLNQALRIGRLERANAQRLEGLDGDRHLGAILSQSANMQSLFQLVKRVAPTDVAVLILGESGTGKELLAREIRRLGRRATKPFVSINCGAIPENLLETELFGHEKGAYTGAHMARPGKLELAHGGTLLLDEIGELPLLLQVKLLRFLQEHEIERVGGRSVIELDVRVIAATNRDLESDVGRGVFREDLYYRLSVMNLKLPPLRDRPDDILYLAQYFLDRHGAEMGRPKLAFSRAAKEVMQRYRWPGNVRELEHHVQRAILLSQGRFIRPSDLEISENGQNDPLSLREVREKNDQRTIVEALRRTCGNISKAARELEISRPSLHDLLRKHGIDANEYKSIRNAEQDEESA